jgi:hypothetical protein
MKNQSINSLMFEGYVNHNRSNILVNENKAQLKQMLAGKKIDQEEFNQILQSDNTPTKKFVGWIGRQYLKTKEPNAPFDWDQLRNAVTEFIAMVNSGSIAGEDSNIEKYPTYEDLQKKVTQANQQVKANPSRSQSEGEVEVYLDNNDALVVAPLNHSAARKLGLSEFAHRTGKDGKKDCAWCITYKNDDHWKDYFENQLITFYFAKPKSEQKLQELQQAFPKRNVQSCAVLVDIAPGTDPESDSPDGVIREGFDADDKKMSKADTEKYLKILGVDV